MSHPEHLVKPLQWIVTTNDQQTQDVLDALWKAFYADLAGKHMRDGDALGKRKGKVMPWGTCRYVNPITDAGVSGALIPVTNRMAGWRSVTVTLPDVGVLPIDIDERSAFPVGHPQLMARIERNRRLLGQSVGGQPAESRRRVSLDISAAAKQRAKLPAAWKRVLSRGQGHNP